jgi:hypothetical protein
MRSSWFSVFPHGCNEAVAPPGDGFDVFASVRAIAQHLPKIEDVTGQIAFLDENTRPDSFQQLFLLDDVPRPLDQNEESFQVLWRDSDGLAIAEQNPLHGIELIGTESV